MILADKIIGLRKRAGWSQEELGAQLGVSRQAVSKWEGAQAVPDMDKILQLSRIFGVTTDYLLKDELDEPGFGAPAAAGDTADTPQLRHVTLGQASEYLRLRQEDAPKIALATFLCIISPIALLLLAALSEMPGSPVTENAAAGVGLTVLLILVAAAVAIFIRCAARAKDFEFLEKEPFETEYGVSGMVKERRAAHRESFVRFNTLGTVLCILSAVPLFLSVCFDAPDYVYVCAVCLLLIIAGVGCIAFISGGVYNSALEKLLEEGDYTRPRKAKSSLLATVSLCYWLAATAIFLFLTFSPSVALDEKQTWFVWPIAGVLYAAVMAVVRLVSRTGK